MRSGYSQSSRSSAAARHLHKEGGRRLHSASYSGQSAERRQQRVPGLLMLCGAILLACAKSDRRAGQSRLTEANTVDGGCSLHSNIGRARPAATDPHCEAASRVSRKESGKSKARPRHTLFVWSTLMLQARPRLHWMARLFIIGLGSGRTLDSRQSVAVKWVPLFACVITPTPWFTFWYRFYIDGKRYDKAA